jgi:hypothetical protein
MRTIKDWYLPKVVGVDAFQTANVIAVFIGIDATNMVRINAALRAEVMLRGHGVELIRGQDFSALNNT